MKLSTKSRYAVTAMVDMVQSSTMDQPVTLTEISIRQLLPIQYLEQLFAKLRRADLVQSIRGQSGGYYLRRSADQITIADIIQAVGEEIRATGCKNSKSTWCHGHKTPCLTHNLWMGLGDVMNGYLQTVTLADVAGQSVFPMSTPVQSSTQIRRFG